MYEENRVLEDEVPMPVLALPDLVRESVIAHDWADALAPAQAELSALETFLVGEYRAGRTWLPRGDRILAAFQQPMRAVRVLIVGQDPYPTPGHSVGLAFAVDRAVRPLPRSLKNIYRELYDDVGITPAPHGDLSSWARSGVMLLNRVLTVEAGVTGSHQRKGWEEVTAMAIRALVERGGPLVAVLWGRQAQTLAPLLGDVPVIRSAHPSPLSASRGFFGSRPFSRANELLQSMGAEKIDWNIQ